MRGFLVFKIIRLDVHFCEHIRYNQFQVVIVTFLVKMSKFAAYLANVDV